MTSVDWQQGQVVSNSDLRVIVLRTVSRRVIQRWS